MNLITNIILDGSPDGTETEDEAEVLRAEREQESNSESSEELSEESSDSGDEILMPEDDIRDAENRGSRVVRGVLVRNGIMRVHSQPGHSQQE